MELKAYTQIILPLSKSFSRKRNNSAYKNFDLKYNIKRERMTIFFILKKNLILIPNSWKEGVSELKKF